MLYGHTKVISGRFPRVYMADLEEALIATLRSCGIEKLKVKQREAVLAFVNGQDVFCFPSNRVWEVNYLWNLAHLV